MYALLRRYHNAHTLKEKREGGKARKKNDTKKGHDRLMYRKGKKEECHATYRSSKHMEQRNIDSKTLKKQWELFLVYKFLV